MMVALGAIPEEQALLMRQRTSGEAMMGTPAAQGRNVGQTYVASSPLEHLSVALERGMGGRRMNAADAGMMDTFQRQTAGRKAGADAYRAQQEAQTKMLLEAMKRYGAQPTEPPAPELGFGFTPGIS